MMSYKIAILSCLILLMAQMLWVPLNLDPMFYVYGDCIFKIGILYSISRLAKKYNFYCFLFLDFFFTLSVFNLINSILFGPYNLTLWPYILFVLVIIRMFVMCAMHHTKLSFKSLLKKVFNVERR